MSKKMEVDNKTKRLLWNKVVKMMGEFDETNKEFPYVDNVGLKSKDGKEVYEFMVDGYVFEVNLIDVPMKIKK